MYESWPLTQPNDCTIKKVIESWHMQSLYCIITIFLISLYTVHTITRHQPETHKSTHMSTFKLHIATFLKSNTS